MFNSRLLIAVLLMSLPFTAHAAKGGGGNKDGDTQAPVESRLAALEKQVLKLQNLLAGVTRDTDTNTGKDTMTFSGLNLQIVNGLGATSVTDGTGNLIIGYNELRDDDDNFRGGSHMLVIGAFNNYTNLAFGGMTVGVHNETDAPFASVNGGADNLVSGYAASIGGGTHNLAGGNYAAVSGGNNNVADGDFASVNGGYLNIANGFYALVSGGVGNTASGWGASVSGGNMNTASWYYASVSGGNENKASGYASSVSGGDAKDAASSYCWEADDQVDC